MEMNAKMKKRIGIIMSLVMVMSLLQINSVSAAKKIALSKKSLTLTVGSAKTIKLKNAKKSKVKWSSSKKSVASVSKSGKITAKKKGTAKITATYKKKKYVCKVTVKNKPVSTVTPKPGTSSGIVMVSSVSLNQTKLLIEVGETETLGAEIIPGNATNRSVRWSSFHTNVATVDQNGNVRGVSTGNALILVEKDDSYGCAHDYCEVTVVRKKPTPTPVPTLSPTRTPSPSPSPTPTVRPSTTPTASVAPTPVPVNTVTKAPLEDHAATNPYKNEAEIIKDYTVQASQATSVFGNVKMVNVTINGTDLLEHVNAAGESGNWVGIGIPEGQEYFQERGSYVVEAFKPLPTLTQKPAGTLSGGKVTFYFDVKSGDANKGYVIVKDKKSGSSTATSRPSASPAASSSPAASATPVASASPAASSSPAATASPGTAGDTYTIYNVDFSKVRVKTGAVRPTAAPTASPGASASPGTSASPAPSASAGPTATPTPRPVNTVTAAPLKDQAATNPIPDNELIYDYTVTAVEGETLSNVKMVNVTITGNRLKEHMNGANMLGHWVGIGILAGNTGTDYLQARGTYVPKFGENIALSQAPDSSLSDGRVTFYFNVRENSSENYGYIIVKDKKTGNGEDTYTIYNIDFSQVKLFDPNGTLPTTKKTARCLDNLFAQWDIQQCERRRTDAIPFS